ncbi:970_t:CDS:2 [Ambispora gerdemannii]|uniref:970_t:CDS:1 n=1 Tax=Ambispora gerdemannii TaxID=144530 RepID=A0A9N9AB16_9GLOM|nr:970_t:CDS:2 [Ambispora gerdemannii]
MATSQDSYQDIDENMVAFTSVTVNTTANTPTAEINNLINENNLSNIRSGSNNNNSIIQKIKGLSNDKSTYDLRILLPDGSSALVHKFLLLLLSSTLHKYFQEFNNTENDKKLIVIENPSNENGSADGWSDCEDEKYNDEDDIFDINKSNETHVVNSNKEALVFIADPNQLRIEYPPNKNLETIVLTHMIGSTKLPPTSVSFAFNHLKLFLYTGKVEYHELETSIFLYASFFYLIDTLKIYDLFQSSLKAIDKYMTRNNIISLLNIAFDVLLPDLGIIDANVDTNDDWNWWMKREGLIVKITEKFVEFFWEIESTSDCQSVFHGFRELKRCALKCAVEYYIKTNRNDNSLDARDVNVKAFNVVIDWLNCQVETDQLEFNQKILSAIDYSKVDPEILSKSIKVVRLLAPSIYPEAVDTILLNVTQSLSRLEKQKKQQKQQDNKKSNSVPSNYNTVDAVGPQQDIEESNPKKIVLKNVFKKYDKNQQDNYPVKPFKYNNTC